MTMALGQMNLRHWKAIVAVLGAILLMSISQAAVSSMVPLHAKSRVLATRKQTVFWNFLLHHYVCVGGYLLLGSNIRLYAPTTYIVTTPHFVKLTACALSSSSVTAALQAALTSNSTFRANIGEDAAVNISSTAFTSNTGVFKMSYGFCCSETLSGLANIHLSLFVGLEILTSSVTVHLLFTSDII